MDDELHSSNLHPTYQKYKSPSGHPYAIDSLPNTLAAVPNCLTMLKNAANSAELDLDKAVFEFADAYARLWEYARKYPEDFPQTVIGCGSIAEYYVAMYLRREYEGASICFPSGNTKGFDIEVNLNDRPFTKYQVKSISPFNKSRRLNTLTKGFDKLIILSLDERFFPDQAFLFENSEIFFETGKNRTLIVPDKFNSRRPGSHIFTQAKNILNDFLLSLE